MELKSERGFGIGYGGGSPIFKIDPSTLIKSKLAPDSWWGKFIISVLPENCMPAEKVPVIAYYVDEEAAHPSDEGGLPKGFQFKQEFRFAVVEDGNVVPPELKFSPQGVFSYEIPVGKSVVRYWVLDHYGHVAKYEKAHYGIPSQYFLGAGSVKDFV